MSKLSSDAAPVKYKKFTKAAIKKDFRRNKVLYLMAVPAIAFFLLFAYLPMSGLIMAFQDYKPKKGIFGSPLIGLKHFITFFNDPFFPRLVRNTLAISIWELLVAFPLTIIFALLLNEIRSKLFKRTIQTVSYMPYFISMVVVSGMIIDFCKSKGVLTQLFSFFTGSSQNILSIPEYWRPLYIGSGIWQGIGFGSIIYVAALSGIDQQLYEAAVIDGANRWKQTLYVTLPGISTTIVIMLILKIGSMMSVGYEKTILLYNPQIYETADIISSYVYRKGLLEFNYGYSSAVSLFNSVINFVLLVMANQFSKKVTDTSLF
ncbi:ABC transporter permease [Butyrivibrio sp. MC2013]|uniref:ABC transporter permease n=1 Tax=Butyrivibrio sp. MC2013 TaxID=1280686 RepID=UPI0003FADE67|nr:ABC transporter permease subunit [Butyrivibrio sp. MC2013]